MRVLSLTAFAVFLIFCSFNLKSFGDNNSSLEATLQQKYAHKAFTIRNFYIDNDLHFDGNGTAKQNDHIGSWTVACIAIQKIKINTNHVEISGKRVAEIYDTKQGKFVPLLTQQDLKISVDRDPNQPEEKVLQALERIFLGPQDHLGNLVPDYWKPLVSDMGEMVPQNHGPDCFRIKGEASRTADGGVVFECEADARTKTANTLAANVDPSTLPYRATKGVTAPHAQFTPDPEYSPVAQAAQVQGVSILHAVITPDGNTKDIMIVRPLGFGLDDEAVMAVKKWTFQPSTLNGKPVSTRISVQVQFHLSSGNNNLLYKNYTR